MPEAKSPKRGYLVLDALLVVGLIVVFLVLNHHKPSSSTEPQATPAVTSGPGSTPTPSKNAGSKTAKADKAAPEVSPSPTPHEPAPISIAKPGDEIDIKRLRSKTVAVTIHTIVMGENYWTIAKSNNTDLYTLIGANPTMPFIARVKQQLLMLSRRGVLYTVKKDDNVAKIAEMFATTEASVKKENGLNWFWQSLKEGDVVFISDVKPILMTKEWDNYFSHRGFFGDPLGRWAKINSAFSFRTDPITGEERHHNGVDLKAKYGDPVYAAANGKVIFTGVSGGYGNLIILAHSNGMHSYYGHLSKIYAKAGTHVRRGTLIGRVGATGRVTGPHLHFELRNKNNKPLDPLLFI